jgi:hypothetical protein
MRAPQGSRHHSKETAERMMAFVPTGREAGQ